MNLSFAILYSIDTQSIFYYAEAKRPKVQIYVCSSPQNKKEAEQGNFSQGKEHCHLS